ncbi:MAG TPA: fumarylacetoacetate hydrolase family protein [bacterium]|nr:fumarylacetoacetate hydrolase family protein [bacterium]
MKLIRFQYGEEIAFGMLQGSDIQVLVGPPTEPLHVERTLKLEEVSLLAPILPTKIIGIGFNYKGHAAELHAKLPEEPLLLLKPPSALNGPEEPIHLPASSQQVEFEGELAVVIGKRCKHLSETEVKEAILGYTCFNDVTARDLQLKDVQFTRAKSFDTFACMGPWIETEIDPSNLKLETRVNGEVKQSVRTSELRFSVSKLVSFVSQVMTLEPGDVISTGTPAGTGPLKQGDKVEVEIEGIGTLVNPVY